jgi:hypothetical protein
VTLQESPPYLLNVRSREEWGHPVSPQSVTSDALRRTTSRIRRSPGCQCSVVPWGSGPCAEAATAIASTSRKHIEHFFLTASPSNLRREDQVLPPPNLWAPPKPRRTSRLRPPQRTGRRPCTSLCAIWTRKGPSNRTPTQCEPATEASEFPKGIVVRPVCRADSFARFAFSCINTNRKENGPRRESPTVIDEPRPFLCDD